MSTGGRYVGHLADEGSFILDDVGFVTAVCSCGWSLGPLPGPEEVNDALMEHAYQAGRTEFAEDIRTFFAATEKAAKP